MEWIIYLCFGGCVVKVVFMLRYGVCLNVIVLSKLKLVWIFKIWLSLMEYFVVSEECFMVCVEFSL